MRCTLAATSVAWVAFVSIAAGNSALAAPAFQEEDGQGADCNKNGIPDDQEIAQGLVTDCNTNGIPDDCDIANGTSSDCNGDGLPDECLLCPTVDIIFVMDTSGSMFDEGLVLCYNIGAIVTQLNTLGITVHASFLGITQGASSNFPCLQGSVLDVLGPEVPGTDGELLDNHEDWGPATAIVADRFGWMPGALRLVVPLFDEGPENGNPCEDPGPDRDAIVNAIAVAVNAGVICSPIAAGGSNQCVIELAGDLAAGTGGVLSLSTDPFSDLAQVILELVLQVCESVTDCNNNSIPDECEPDCNGNGIPDDCDGGCPPIDLRCEEFNRFENLTQNDTLTLVTNFHNPESEQGFVYAYAVDQGNSPIGFDHLTGQVLVVNGLEAFEYSVNAVDYRAAVPHGMPTDVDGDGIRDLNGIEYEKTAGEILVPRFIGQVGPSAYGELILISLSGGTEFDTTVDFLIYNDNEVAFSSEYTFFCWDKVPLLQISNAFSNDFLKNSSGDDPEESLGTREYGWFRFDGAIASSSVISIVDPAVYGVYVERIGSFAAADLPFEVCLQSGHLLPRSVTGDNEERQGLPSDQDCSDNIGRRKPGSLLLYPEFNNRQGVVTVLTITNTSRFEGVRVHFKYIGRFGAP